MWTETRAAWWKDWARDTNRFIREVDHDPLHEIYLEDGEYVLSDEARNATGVDFGRVAKPFDAVGAYTEARWDDTQESSERAVAQTRSVIEKTRAAIGPDKKVYASTAETIFRFDPLSENPQSTIETIIQGLPGRRVTLSDGTKKILKKLDASCVNCHNDFRNEP